MITILREIPEYEECELTGHRFGEFNQLEVLGKKNTKPRLYYVVKCHICVLDEELCGCGHFKMDKANILKGNTPCVCRKGFLRTEEMGRILVSRAYENSDIDFIGWDKQGYKHGKTKILVNCPKHGIGPGPTIDHLNSSSIHLCIKCAKAANKPFRYTYEEAVNKILESGKFSTSVKFTRLDTVDNQGRRTYWKMYCPECEQTVQAKFNTLIYGHVPCGCYMSHQKYCYIYLVSDSDNSVACIKYGITANTRRRFTTLKSLNSNLKLDELYIFEFEDNVLARKAETSCKRLFSKNHLMTSEDMPQGYTETTELVNIDTIIEIYVSYRGRQIK